MTTRHSPLSEASRGAHSRRDFLRLLGLGGVAALLPLAGCNDTPVDPAARAVVELRDDTGRLNGVYALLQVQGEVFERLRRTEYTGKTRAEAEAFTEIVDHTTAHIQFVTRRLRERRIYDLLVFDLEGVPFGQRGPALALARTLGEGVAAAHVWTTAAMDDPELALVVAKMGAVHARHAAILRGFAAPSDPTAFAAAPAVAANGRTAARPLADVLESVRPYLRTDLQIRG